MKNEKQPSDRVPGSQNRQLFTSRDSQSSSSPTRPQRPDTPHLFKKTLGEDLSLSKCYTAAEVEGAAAQTDRYRTDNPATLTPIASHTRETHNLLKHSDYDKVNFWKDTTFGVTVPDYTDTSNRVCDGNTAPLSAGGVPRENTHNHEGGMLSVHGLP